MDFDIDLAKENTKDNPVYYVQYAYARAAINEKIKSDSYTSACNNLDYLTWSKSFQF